MKSHIDDILTVYESIHSDISTQLGIPSKHLDRSLLRLNKCTHSRGVAFLLVTLPEVCKWFDHSISRSYAEPINIQGVARKGPFPLLWSELFERVFSEDGSVKPNECIDSVFFIRTLLCLAKKYRDIPCTPESEIGAINDFFSIDSELPYPRESWFTGQWRTIQGNPLYGGPDIDELPGAQAPLVSILPLPVQWNSLRILSGRILGSELVDVWATRPRHGPGAVSDRSGKFYKYDFPSWPERLEDLFPYDYFGSGNLISEYPKETEHPARLICVPKTFKGPRLICSEMTADQWIQQGILGHLKGLIAETALSRSVRLSSQEDSRMRTIQASLDGHSCTVDLSSASDRLSCNLVEYIFGSRSDYLDMFRAVRNGKVVQNISPETLYESPVRKFSTQGSALTFPVQSIVFAILSMWAICLHRKLNVTKVDLKGLADMVTVFGDDIIIPNDCFLTLYQVFETCGLRVNASKSFWNGNFKESCGMDAYKGHDVTPAYYTRTYTGSPESTAACVALSNNFFIKGLWKTAEHISKPLSKVLPVNSVRHLLGDKRSAQKITNSLLLKSVVSSAISGGQGLLSFVGSCYIHLPIRWCSDLHQWEYKYLKVSSRDTKVLGTDYARLSQNFFEVPADHVMWEAGSPGRAKLRTRLAWAPL